MLNLKGFFFSFFLCIMFHILEYERWSISTVYFYMSIIISMEIKEKSGFALQGLHSLTIIHETFS